MKTNPQALSCCKWSLEIWVSFSKNWVILVFRNYGEGKKKLSISLVYLLNMPCLTSFFYLSTFSALFWKQCYWWASAQSLSYKPIPSEKSFGYIYCTSNYPFHSFWKCFCFLNPLQHPFVLCTDSQVLPSVLLWASTYHSAGEIWSHRNTKILKELCNYEAILNGGTSDPWLPVLGSQICHLDQLGWQLKSKEWLSSLEDNL